MRSAIVGLFLLLSACATQPAPSATTTPKRSGANISSLPFETRAQLARALVMQATGIVVDVPLKGGVVGVTARTTEGDPLITASETLEFAGTMGDRRVQWGGATTRFVAFFRINADNFPRLAVDATLFDAAGNCGRGELCALRRVSSENLLARAQFDYDMSSEPWRPGPLRVQGTSALRLSDVGVDKRCALAKVLVARGSELLSRLALKRSDIAAYGRTEDHWLTPLDGNCVIRTNTDAYQIEWNAAMSSRYLLLFDVTVVRWPELSVVVRVIDNSSPCAPHAACFPRGETSTAALLAKTVFPLRATTAGWQ